ncbi:MAG: DUF4238 domain-containing protein [Mycobacterium sp.]
MKEDANSPRPEAKATAHEQALRELIDEARRSGESTSAPRGHHLVPAFYLNRWADDDKLRVTDIDRRKSWVTTPKRAAKETDYYRIESSDLDPNEIPPMLFEVTLSKVEQWGADFINAAITDPADAARDDELRMLFSLFMGFQCVRGRSYRNVICAAANDSIKLAYGDITDVGIRHVLAHRGIEATADNIALFQGFVDDLNSGNLTVSPEKAALIGMSGQLAYDIGQSLFVRGWRIYQVPRVLVTCDEPVISIAGPPHPRSERAGVSNAGVVIFPLTPGLLLAMFNGVTARPAPPDELGPHDLGQINREIISAASTYVFERPGRNLAGMVKVPKAADPITRAKPVPIDGTGQRAMIRSYRPTRWSNARRPPSWPVERWFR